jgi:hypothetical protein
VSERESVGMIGMRSTKLDETTRTDFVDRYRKLELFVALNNLEVL